MTVEPDPIPGCTEHMLLIPCPWCGWRDEREFDYGGSHVEFPKFDNSLKTDVAEWHKAVHLRDNTRGDVRELWYHRSGCERWVVATRNTQTHEFCVPPEFEQNQNSDHSDAD